MSESGDWQVDDRVSTDAGIGHVIHRFDEYGRVSYVVQWDGTSSRGLYEASELHPVLIVIACSEK